MYKLYNGLFPEALNELYVKKNQIHHIQTSTDSFLNVSARIRHVNTTNIDVTILVMQFKSVLKVYLHKKSLILKNTR